MTKSKLPCPHCLVSTLIEAHIPAEAYSVQELVSSMVEITLDMISAADPREQQALSTAAVTFLMEGICDIHAGRYKTKYPNIDDVQGHA